MMVSHRVQSTVDGFDFNSKLTDSVECSLKQPLNTEFCWLYSICKYWKGAGDRNNRVTLVIHLCILSHFKRIWKNVIPPTSTSHCVKGKDLFHWSKKKKCQFWLNSRNEMISLLMTGRICYSNELEVSNQNNIL